MRALFLAVLLTGCASTPRHYAYVVMSGSSMAPTFRAGDIRPVLAKPFDQLDGTEIVLRARPGKPVLCHRLVKRTLFGGWTTKGDANDAWDRDALYESNYLGVVMP